MLVAPTPVALVAVATGNAALSAVSAYEKLKVTLSPAAIVGKYQANAIAKSKTVVVSSLVQPLSKNMLFSIEGFA
ncbi:unannotated protein [freshwater metagenome]|uniref:Unannotated protein n=1 Tax=freshwater metagenome TaxID=449393 RepID=A0A6J7F1N0_9ZZZZ